ncbi:MAG TPA: lipocalin-like domain-containing protein [Gammaproteobacteria bacterium]|nr:lipocalin-like domain-containing protein [Gammaproteobacteria bacterium]
MIYQRLPNILYALSLVLAGLGTAHAEDLASLKGTWIMVSAYEIHADGSRTTNYGEHPDGLFIVDAAGRYSMQIFRVGRPVFASGDKARGTPDEYRAALMGISTHIGKVSIDASHHQLVFDVEASSFPNWEGKRQVRDYTFEKGVLSYAVPASASGSGTTAYSVWRRAGD